MEGAKNSKGGKRDRLSSLPDCLLHLIMSFMTTQEAVQTCVLSKRWKNLWTTLPYLNFNLGAFIESNQLMLYGLDRRLKRIQCDRFRDFVSTTLLLRDRSDVHTFRLSCRDLALYDVSINPWILYVCNHNPKVLDIEISSVKPIAGFLTCSSLENVSFTFKQMEPLAGVIKLPHLKWLYLAGVLLNQDFVEKLFRGCPVVETLHFNGCLLNVSAINSCNLKYLSIRGMCFEVGKVLELINVPNLLSFEYSGCASYLGLRVILNLPSLTNANIETHRCASGGHWICKGKDNIFAGMSNVQNLKLKVVMVKGLFENELPKCANFENLKDLCVDGLCLSCNFSLLVPLLNHSPNLQKLSLLHRGCDCTVLDHFNLFSFLYARDWKNTEILSI